MQDSTRIIAIRHGQTAWNAETRIQGHLDIPLDEVGHGQAMRLGRALEGEAISTIYASDLTRAMETAGYVSRATGAPIVAEPGLRERGFGDFEGRTFREIESERPEDARRWRQRDPQFQPQGGETLVALNARVVATAERLAARHPGELIALVGHGGVMDVLYRAATRLDLAAARTWALGNAAINRLLWSPEGFSLVGWSDTQHLEGPLDETTL
ncbi:MAG: histidine phosphatase family protein [Pseudomonadota bacterium]